MELLRRATGRIPKVGLLPGVKIGSNAGKMPAFLFFGQLRRSCSHRTRGGIRTAPQFCAILCARDLLQKDATRWIISGRRGDINTSRKLPPGGSRSAFFAMLWRGM